MDEDILEVSELAGDRVVELRVIDELRVVGLITCVAGDIVKGDEGPVGGVAQVVYHGVKVVGVHGEDVRGCDIVQSDHAPQAGVAQGIFNGDLIRRRDRHQVELEEELEEEEERRVRRDHSRNKTQVRMHGCYGMTHKARP